MNDQRFFDLAMKAIRQQATAAERAELDAAMERQPELRVEFERLQADDKLAREVLPVAAASEATEGELPGYARGRLRTKVRETFGTPATKQPERKPFWTRWGWIGLAAGVAALALVFSLRVEPPRPVEIQVAMLDLAGATRGSNTNELAVLKQIQPAEISTFASESGLASWEKAFPADSKQDVVKIIYDRTAGEVRVVGRVRGEVVQAVFAVGDNLTDAVNKAAAFARSPGRKR